MRNWLFLVISSLLFGSYAKAGAIRLFTARRCRVAQYAASTPKKSTSVVNPECGRRDCVPPVLATSLRLLEDACEDVRAITCRELAEDCVDALEDHHGETLEEERRTFWEDALTERREERADDVDVGR